MRPVVIGIDLVLLVVLVIAAGIFGLNGHQWGWWQHASWVGAVVVVAGAIAASRRGMRLIRRTRRGPCVGAAVLGSTLVVIAVGVMSARYSDPYSGPLFWPHTLAFAALCGLGLFEVGLLGLASRGTVGE